MAIKKLLEKVGGYNNTACNEYWMFIDSLSEQLDKNCFQ